MNDFQDPYLYAGTNVLRNLSDELDPEAAAAEERAMSLIRCRERELYPVNAGFDFRHLQEIHRRLYRDVWAWAGKVRTVEITKGSSHFGEAPNIEAEFAIVHEWLTTSTTLTTDPEISDRDFVEHAAKLLQKINRIHPFREGNGRTQRAYLDQIANVSGRTLSWRNIYPSDNTRASIAAFNANNGETLQRLLLEALEPPVDGLELLDDALYVATPSKKVGLGPIAPSQTDAISAANTTQQTPDETASRKLSPEQLKIRMRRFPELFLAQQHEDQQRANSATDPDYF